MFRLFLDEQTRPDDFYSAIAQDSVDQLGDWCDLTGARVLDVGGGPGYFGRAFARAGARYVGVELDVAGDLPAELFGLCASGENLPIQSESVDVAYSSNVVEHMRHPWTMTDELVRVTRPGGLVFVSFTPWLSPHGGHETKPWHYLGGDYARRRYRRRTGHDPKNVHGQTLFGYRVAQLYRWAERHPDVEVLARFPRYHPSWAWWVARVPGLAEFAVWNVVVVLRRR